MPSDNRAILACAGSGKTTEIVESAKAPGTGRALLVTYTVNNAAEIRARLCAGTGFIPAHTDVSTWFSFLLVHFVRPYQRAFWQPRVAELAWVDARSAMYVPKTNVARYYFSPEGRIYRDKLAEFGVACNTATGGKVIARLQKIYDVIYIDEFQDLAGWDFEVVELLLKSGIRTVFVGDHRQCTYTTNNSAKNKQYVGEGILKLIEKWSRQKACVVQNRTTNRRGNQAICDLADYTYPYTDPIRSEGVAQTDHDGAFVIAKADLPAYCAKFKPQVLRWDRTTKCDGQDAMNFGASKGLSFPRVLIYPNGPIRKFLTKNDRAAIAKAKAKLYVAVTRARHSVAFVLDEECAVPLIARYSDHS